MRTHKWLLSWLFLAIVTPIHHLEAAPVLFQFAIPLGMGNTPFLPNPPNPLAPLNGTLFFGSLVFDDQGLGVANLGQPGATPISSPITYASLQLGPSSFSLSQLAPNPFFTLNNTGFFGPSLAISPQFLPQGITSFAMTQGGWLDHNYSWDPNVFPPGANPPYNSYLGTCLPYPSSCLWSFSALPPNSTIPEAGSLLYGLGSATTFTAVALRRRRKRAPAA